MISKKPYFAMMAAMALGSGCMSESDPVNSAPNAMITAPQPLVKHPLKYRFRERHQPTLMVIPWLISGVVATAAVRLA